MPQKKRESAKPQKKKKSAKHKAKIDTPIPKPTPVKRRSSNQGAKYIESMLTQDPRDLNGKASDTRINKQDTRINEEEPVTLQADMETIERMLRLMKLHGDEGIVVARY